MKNRSTAFRRVVWAAVVVVVLTAMGFGTKVVASDSAEGAAPGTFHASDYAKAKFPEVKKDIIAKANDLIEVATALAADPTAAAGKYGVTEGDTGSAAVYSVKFSGVAGTAESGIMPITVEGLPGKLLIRVQMGPAINGTDLRDATGKIHFPDFTNQIDYQNAGAALNDQLKKQVLSKISADQLAGKTVSVVGAFQLVNPDAYLITPVKIVAE